MPVNILLSLNINYFEITQNISYNCPTLIENTYACTLQTTIKYIIWTN